MSANSTLSGYRILWIMALFDLPVITKPQRKRAQKFREYLLDEGFMMMQLSCYIRFAASKDYAEALSRRIGEQTPPEGKVDLIYFTDVQYGNIKSFRGVHSAARPQKPNQLTLF